jgi:undecaprenyl-phosphate galactose phosphotransferase
MQPTVFSSSGVEKLQQLRTIAASGDWQISIRHDFWKRTFDIVFSLLFLSLFSPLFLALALLVRCTSSGPVFYKSRRLGRGGKLIECWKFRSMYKDADERLCDLLQSDLRFRAEWEAFQKVKEDPRITPVGRFLRKTSLDEIPQFWNVLKGDLSVVGPRPPTLMGPPERFLDEIRLLYGERAERILSVRPGITGAWQISGRSQIPFEERCRIEESYAASRTFWKDLVLIAKTIPAVLFSKGAF